jgi:energy-coupling factor transporter ATP-binding protein EcfA2
MEDIIEFSGLGDFIDMPFRTYSSGMQLRLAFAVSTTVSPQILILDEWLSTGDENFRERAEDRMRRVVDSTDILILASHTRSLLSSNCDRVVWLEHGKIRMDDEAGKVLDAYFGPEVVVKSWHEKETAPAEEAAPTLADRIAEAAGQPRELVFPPDAQPGGDEVKIVSCRLADAEGRTLTGTVRTSEPFRLEMEFDVLQDGHHLRPGCMVCDREGAVVLWSADADVELFRRLAKPGRRRACVEFPGRLLAPGLFQFVVAVGDAKTGSRSFAAIRNILPLEVTDDPDDREVRGAFRGPLPGIVRPLLPWTTKASGGES